MLGAEKVEVVLFAVAEVVLVVGVELGNEIVVGTVLLGEPRGRKSGLWAQAEVLMVIRDSAKEWKVDLLDQLPFLPGQKEDSVDRRSVLLWQQKQRPGESNFHQLRTVGQAQGDLARGARHRAVKTGCRSLRQN